MHKTKLNPNSKFYNCKRHSWRKKQSKPEKFSSFVIIKDNFIYTDCGNLWSCDFWRCPRRAKYMSSNCSCSHKWSTKPWKYNSEVKKGTVRDKDKVSHVLSELEIVGTITCYIFYRQHTTNSAPRFHYNSLKFHKLNSQKTSASFSLVMLPSIIQTFRKATSWYFIRLISTTKK